MRKIVLGLVAATVAIPTVASAQPGYDPYYGGSRYTHPADRNRDGVVTNREARRYERQIQRQRDRAYNNGAYGSSYGAYGNNYNGYGNSYNNGYGNSYGGGYGNTYSGGYGNSYGGAYGNSYGGNYGSSYGGSYGQYYDRSGYYSGPTWRGDDGRYHCRRSNGSTGTLVGGAAGALIGSQVAGDRTLGAIVGGAIGAVIGNSVQKNSNRYRCN